MNPAVGVDLGTTNTVVGVQTDDTGPRLLEIKQPVDQRNVLDGVDHIKSAVYFESEDSAVVGAWAAENRLDAFRSIKSRMGTRWVVQHPHRKKTRITPPWISAHILKPVYAQILQNYPAWDHQATVTVPASFNTDQRNHTLRAATLAGFQNVHLLDEPTAAFYYFLDQNRDAFARTKPQTILVFDFGGGTLDVSIIKVATEGEFLCIDPIGRSRYNNLGGDDIDIELAALFLAIWENQEHCSIEEQPAPERAKLVQLFIKSASEFKEEAEYYIALGQHPQEFIIDAELPQSLSRRKVHFRRQLTRPQYEEISGRFVLDKGDLNIFRPIGQATQVAGSIVPEFRKEQLDLVLYTGGASRMLGLRAALKAYFAPTPCFSISDEDACNTVALGAASCRYDEQHGQRGVKTTYRLLENILTINESGEYVTVVPLTCEPSTEFSTAPTVFHSQQPAVRLKLPLFRGAGPNDHHLAPMEDLELKLPRVIGAKVPYTLSYRMTQNKTIEIRALFLPQGTPPIQVDGEVKIHQEGRVQGPPQVPLARVNQV